MTRARYSASDNTLKEISQMERPLQSDFKDPVWCPTGECRAYFQAIQQYEKHVAGLRTIPCHDSCRGLWKEGDVLMEGEDYKVGPFNVGEFKPKVLAYPLVPVKSEDDPYEELLTMIARSSWDRNEIIAEAKKQFIVTKR